MEWRTQNGRFRGDLGSWSPWSSAFAISRPKSSKTLVSRGIPCTDEAAPPQQLTGQAVHGDLGPMTTTFLDKHIKTNRSGRQSQTRKTPLSNGDSSQAYPSPYLPLPPALTRVVLCS